MVLLAYNFNILLINNLVSDFILIFLLIISSNNIIISCLEVSNSLDSIDIFVFISEFILLSIKLLSKFVILGEK